MNILFPGKKKWTKGKDEISKVEGRIWTKIKIVRDPLMSMAVLFTKDIHFHGNIVAEA